MVVPPPGHKPSIDSSPKRRRRRGAKPTLFCRFQSERVPLWEISGYQRSGCGAIRLTTHRDRTSSPTWLAPAPWLWGEAIDWPRL